MPHRRLLLPLALIAATPATYHAQDAASVIADMERQRVESFRDVRVYVVDRSIMGQRARAAYEHVELKAPDGRTVPIAREIPLDEAERSRAMGQETQTMTPEGLRAYSQGLRMTGDALSTEYERGLKQAGLPPGLLLGGGGDPWTSTDPRVMMGGMAEFTDAAASAQEQAASRDRGAEDREQLSALVDFRNGAKYVGKEKVDGHTAHVLRADGLNRTQKADGQEFTLNTVTIWVDAEHHVPLRTKIDGVAKAGGQTRPITIERLDTDYRKVPGCSLYEPYRSVMKLGGMLDAKQQKEMREAQKKLAEFDKQLAEMPAAQRQMVMSTMGSRLDMMRKMASGGGFEVETEVHEITCNPDQLPE